MKRASALVVWLLFAGTASAETISLDAYLASLERLNALLAANQLAAARTQAVELAEHDVSSPHGRFHTDTALLAAVAKSTTGDLRLQTRIAATIGELRSGIRSEGANADRAMLARVAAEQKVAKLPEGGDVPVHAEPAPILERLAESIGEVVNWIGEQIARFLEWLLDFLPRIRRDETGATGGMRWIVTGLVTVIVLLIVLLAIEVTRRSRRAAAKPVETSAPIGSKRDEDPLSRGAAEWERYAEQLAAAGRLREAIRAWFHAVLVTCYAAGVLHYRKSRTNWEYIAALAPSVSWRAELMRLTRRFEREWYGSDRSTHEALDECAQSSRAIIDAVRAAARGTA
ncbi:MAG TPA: DUF4129 domain-containing protein [Thermoanaerobaculia bacterium]|nr:DUF4129 domain-containing protein [Thermoanaerobaculia bacterium]